MTLRPSTEEEIKEYARKAKYEEEERMLFRRAAKEFIQAVISEGLLEGK